jgi:hypothetical protein
LAEIHDGAGSREGRDQPKLVAEYPAPGEHQARTTHVTGGRIVSNVMDPAGVELVYKCDYCSWMVKVFKDK